LSAAGRFDLGEHWREGVVSYIAYAVVRIFGFFLGVLPYVWAQKVGSALGRFVAFVDWPHIRRAVSSIQPALGISEAEAKKIAIASYRHVGMVVAEFFQMARMKSPEEFRKYVVLDSSKDFHRYFDEGKGAVAPTGHFGNWEYCGQMMAVEGMSPGSIVKPFKNGYLARFVDDIRERWGLVCVEKSKRGVVEAVRRVRSGLLMGIMSDQHADEGIETTFFGRPCKTVDTAARIAKNTGAPMVPATSYRREDGKHVLVVWPEIKRPEGVSDEVEAVRLMTQEMNYTFEKAIREHPEQWMWTHRRYRATESTTTPPSTMKAESA
jgi:KDO2-lipid IV(A) lauroyltransferase